ncbi:CMRF35-like molecule 8 [Falco peregrinus]|uniref:CMRF35-like molecule 8 n=1 Tax=Falco peregrinus TaxID=8954 RepID=UPI002479359D|nr:CMRF35-like molecule 8 [Falco peregrinus]
MMGILLGWSWLLLPVCQALVVPREVSGHAGEKLSLRCWYPRGYEDYNKYWCEGASRHSCRKVVETAGRDVPQQHGRVSIQDSHIFCVVLLTVQNLSETDAGSYWCGVERTGSDLMEPVTVRVLPAVAATPAAPLATLTPWISSTMMEHTPATNATTMGPGGPVLNMVLLSLMVVLFSLLALAGSTRLLCILCRRCRRREGNGALVCPVPGTPRCPSQDMGDKPTLGTGLQGAPHSQQHRKPALESVLSATQVCAAPRKPGIATELDDSPVYDNLLNLAEVRAPGAGSVGSTGRAHAVWLLTLGSPHTAQLCPRAVGTRCPLARVATVTQNQTSSWRTPASSQTPCVSRR